MSKRRSRPAKNKGSVPTGHGAPSLPGKAPEEEPRKGTEVQIHLKILRCEFGLSVRRES